MLGEKRLSERDIYRVACILQRIKLNLHQRMNGFERDENKIMLNQGKHKIAFEDAADVFNDEDRLTYSTDKQGETRFLTIGKAFQAINSVVYTARDLVIRIISARRASQNERQAYLSNKFKNRDDE
ncbi:MAG: BrnT family toxin [Saprospiraceae bacterium]|nr:BrnT family toxin [Saprospiraceae bacterium]